MSDMQSDLNRAQQLAVTAHSFAIFALIAIAVTLTGRTGMSLKALLTEDARDYSGQMISIGVILIQLLPTILLWQAVNRLRHALVHYSKGDFFCREASAQVAAAGNYGIQAMIAFILIVPNLSAWIQSQGGFSLRVENETLGVLAFTLFISAVGRILGAAATLKEENEAFI